MNFYKLVVAYDGTGYAGWQSQADGTSVAEAFVSAFKSVFAVDLAFQGVSRTDAGVHAFGQVVWLKTPLDLDPEKLKFAWNNRLGRDLMIRSVSLVEPDARREAQLIDKTYFYHFFTERPQPFVARYGWHCGLKLDLNKLEQALRVFIGTHDFRSFCTGDEWPDTIRTINELRLVPLQRPHAFRIIVRGPRFLRYMIRRIVGACIQVAGNSRIKIGYLEEVLQQCCPQQVLRNAPPKGLMLYQIRYAGDEHESTEPLEIF